MKINILGLTFFIASKILTINYSSAQELFGYPVDGTNVTPKCYFGDACASATKKHAGVDFSKSNGTNVKASASGKVSHVMNMSSGDHGLGNTVIIEHRLNNGIVRYSMYSHLNSINAGIQVGAVVSKGQSIGVMGASGKGCATYWCNTNCSAPVGCSNTHLHFEIKNSNVISNPCGRGTHYGYTTNHPADYCYQDPLYYINNSSMQVLRHPNLVHPINTNLTSSSVTFQWGAISGATNYRIQVKKSNGNGWTAENGFTSSSAPSTSIPVNNTTGTQNSFSITLEPNTTYYWTVRVANNSTNSFYTPPVSFTTGTNAGGGGSSNDNVCGAINLTASSICSYLNTSNNSATISTYPSNAGNCAAIGKDVWFKTTIPSSSIITIRTQAGTLTNGVMAVYGGSTCSNLSYITCEDNNTNPGANGSAMPVISIPGPVGTDVWIRFWGHGNSTGTFGICILNYGTLNMEAPKQYLVAEQEAVERSTFETNENLQIYAFPNPASSLLNIALTSEKSLENVNLRLINTIGQTVRTKSTSIAQGENFFSEDISTLPNGTYILLVGNNIFQKQLKIVIAP